MVGIILSSVSAIDGASSAEYSAAFVSKLPNAPGLISKANEMPIMMAKVVVSRK